ncbi:scavenger receptor class F member 2-like [Haliotis rufescens]|uniref:scavenger receptor class F member 2-like n=1 Tax=Haliotis rufescens TaxID=6454 RepID=UPI00201EAC6F|nr:scavenger receptor class F member 2-like [Haliotis rufescens]
MAFCLMVTVFGHHHMGCASLVREAGMATVAATNVPASATSAAVTGTQGDVYSVGAGYHATTCTETCPPNCRHSHGDKPYCDRETGNCLENCQGGWWGTRCDNKCSDRCEDNSCYGWDGSCSRGCRKGWVGDSCDTRCPGGCQGDTCEQYGSHTCTRGCKHGLHGHHCNKQCNRHCRDQDCFYDHSMKSTVCRQGCVDGWMSLDCKLKCPGNCEACSQETGECSRCKQGY